MRFFVLLAVAASVGCALGDCDVDASAATLAGAGAVDCGHVIANDDATTAVQCALDAQAAGKAFRVRFDRRGIDSAVADVFVRTADGRAHRLAFDSAGMSTGGSGVARVWRTPCARFEKGPESSAGPGGADLACISPASPSAECE